MEPYPSKASAEGLNALLPSGTRYGTEADVRTEVLAHLHYDEPAHRTEVPTALAALGAVAGAENPNTGAVQRATASTGATAARSGTFHPDAIALPDRNPR